MNPEDRWSKCSLSEGEWLRADFAGLSIVVLNAYEEWRIATLPEDHKALPSSGQLQDLPDDLVWERWDNDPSDTTFHFRPTYPSMPVVARPVSILNLSPKGSASFFVGIPAWIEVMAECQGSLMPLAAFPVVELSKTWHGNNLAGHLGYALKTFARRVFEPEVWPEYDIICPIGITNDGDVMLPFNRLYLETDHLSVFESEGRLWSNAARIHVGAGNSDLSDITYASRPAKPYDLAVEMTPPRKGRTRKSSMRSAFTKVMGSFNPLEE